MFSFYCENNFAAPGGFYFMEYGLKWLFKCKRLSTPVLDALHTLTARCGCSLRENVGRLEIAARMWPILPHSSSRPWLYIVLSNCYILAIYMLKLAT